MAVPGCVPSYVLRNHSDPGCVDTSHAAWHSHAASSHVPVPQQAIFQLRPAVAECKTNLISHKGLLCPSEMIWKKIGNAARWSHTRLLNEISLNTDKCVNISSTLHTSPSTTYRSPFSYRKAVAEYLTELHLFRWQFNVFHCLVILL